jgi:hypothetical protein
MSDVKDYVTMVLVTGFGAAATWYLFLPHHDNTAFSIWSTILGTLIGAYHFLNIHDDKVKDAG